MLRGVAFDMDGLMFDTENLALEIWQEVGREHGLFIPREALVATCGLDMQHSRQVLKEYMGQDFDYDGLRREKLKRLFDRVENGGIPIKPGLIDLLKELKKSGIKTVVATSSERERAERYLRLSGVDRYFDAVVSGDQIERGKPAPDIYLRAAQLLSLAPGEMLALEDAPKGVQAAHAAGMQVIMVPDLIQPTEQTAAMLTACCTDLYQVRAFVQRQPGA